MPAAFWRGLGCVTGITMGITRICNQRDSIVLVKEFARQVKR